MSDDSLLEQLADDFIQNIRKGKLPDIEAYALKHPELADRIRELFPTLMLLEGMANQSGSESLKPLGQTGLPPGNMFGQYRIEREIGRGGMGIVYEAHHIQLERRVALKILPIHPTMDANHLERFFREARTAAGLHHTNIVPVFDVGQISGTPYFAMQYIEGRSLDAILRIIQPAIEENVAVIASSDPTVDINAETTFSPEQDVSSKNQENRTSLFFQNASIRTKAGLPEKLEEYFRWVAEIGIQAANGLAHAHERKVIHRDIKPSNLIIDKQGVVWIADFGLARRIEDPAMTHSGMLIGTPRYMSPEQAEATRHPVDQRSDIYSLGATLYELLTCRSVFEGKTPHDVISQIITTEPVAPKRLSREIPADLSTIIMKAMAKRPEDRYQSASQLKEDLSRWRKMEPIKARRIGPLGRAIRWCRRNPRLATVVAIAAALILSLSSVFYVDLMMENEETQQALMEKSMAVVKAREKLEERKEDINQGVKSWAVRDYASAQKYFQAAILISPNSPDDTPYMYLATTYMMQFIPGSMDPMNEQMAYKAIEMFNDLVKRSEKYGRQSTTSMIAISTLYYQLKNFKSAREWCNRVIGIEPKNDFDRTSKAQAHYRIATMDYSAVNEKTKTMGERPKLLEEDKAEIQETIDEGLEHLKKARELIPDYSNAVMCQSLLLREKAKIEEDEKKRAELIKQADLAYQNSAQLKLKSDAEAAAEAAAQRKKHESAMRKNLDSEK